jgi:hypothetical protein
MSKTFVGIDNGVTGSIGVISPDGKSAFIETPVLKCRNYTQKEQFLHRIDWKQLVENLPNDAEVILERPMVNPSAFIATESALRALEATIIALEMRDIPYSYIDSKQWQKEFISSSVMGHKEMKKASCEIGIQLFPNHTSKIKKHGDADGLLIAEFARRRSEKSV